MTGLQLSSWNVGEAGPGPGPSSSITSHGALSSPEDREPTWLTTAPWPPGSRTSEAQAVAGRRGRGKLWGSGETHPAPGAPAPRRPPQRCWKPHSGTSRRRRSGWLQSGWSPLAPHPAGPRHPWPSAAGASGCPQPHSSGPQPLPPAPSGPPGPAAPEGALTGPQGETFGRGAAEPRLPLPASRNHSGGAV